MGRDSDDVCTVNVRRYAAQTTDVRSTTGVATLKPFSEIPGPKGLPVIGTLWDFLKTDGFKFNKMFEVRMEHRK